MIFGLNTIMYLLAMLIVAARTLEETRITPEYSYIEKSCLNLMPSQMMEANMSSQAGEDAPFRARFVYKNEPTYTYKPNHEYRIIISSEDDNLFMGFIANMRLARDPTVIVGRVIQPQDNRTLVKTMNCNGTNNTATQMRNTQHTSVEFIWIAPKDLNETVILRFGVFKNRSVFWNDLHTPCIVPAGVNLFPSICPTLLLSSSISSNSVYTSIISSSSSYNFPPMSVDFSSSYSLPSSSTTFQSMPRSNSVRSSSAASPFSTQSRSSVLPTPSISKVSQSTGVKSEQHTKHFPTTSVFLLSKVLTYTSSSKPLPTPGAIGVTSTSSDMTTASSLDVTGNKMTPSPNNTATTSATAAVNGSKKSLSDDPAAVTSNKNGGLLNNPSEMMAIGIAVGFVLIIIVSQIVILFVGCFYKRRQNKKSRSRSPSFRTLYSLDTASVRSESIRRSYRAYNRDVDLKLNIIEIDECPNNNTDSSSGPQTVDNHSSSNADSSSAPQTESIHSSNNTDSSLALQTEDNHTSQPPSGDSVASNVQVDVHPTDH